MTRLRETLRHARYLGAVAAFLAATATPAVAQDADGDTIPDLWDNCVDVVNLGQENGDFDRFGDRCDGDLNNDGVTDSADRTLLDAEIQAGEPVAPADVDGSGVVDAADLTYFDANLLGAPPGPAGAEAHDDDGDGVLDFCVPPAPPAPFADQWDPTQHPDLLLNGTLASTSGSEPDDWDPTTPNYVAYRSDMATTGVYQVMPFGGFGGITPGNCYGACVAPSPIPVTTGSTYAFSFMSCAGSFPPAAMWVVFDEYDATGTPLPATAPAISASKAMSSTPGIWEETIFFYTPSSTQVASARPKLGRKSDPAGGNTTYFTTDFAFWALDASGSRTYRYPPAVKRAFDGARTRVDALGNVSVREPATQQFERFFPIGVYGAWQRGDFGFYTAMGFNTFMNDRGVNLAAPAAVAAGMRFMVNTTGLWDPALYPQVDDVLSSLALNALDPQGVSVPVYDSLLAFHTDNENFSQCILDGSQCAVPRVTPWNGWLLPQPGITTVGPIPDLYAFDRAQNGGERGVPHYFLNGNPDVARAYANDPVNAEGDLRMDVTGSYGVSGFEQVGHAANQTAPATIIQIQAHEANAFIPLAWAGVARGARGIATWRDRPTNGYFLRAPTLRICGTSLPALTPRVSLENPPGSVVEGATSEAQAEILDDEGAFSGCPGSEIGRSYHVKLQPNGTAENYFLATEALVDPATGAFLGDAYVHEVTGSYEVVHVGSLDQYDWATELPDFRDDMEILAPVLEGDPRTAWTARCTATVADIAGNPAVGFGDEGITCGTRTVGDALYLIVSNTYFDIDPFADYLQQHIGHPLDVDVALSGLPGSVYKVRFYDFATDTFGNPSPLKDEALSFALPAFGRALIEIRPPGQ